jgi:hypothetical protein
VLLVCSKMKKNSREKKRAEKWFRVLKTLNLKA